ncbi:sulfotransferase domain-containing protein [Sneathiella sp.]|uniref:sulfotransferase domain-containing protein n=1 Tax=Sneathiella sp. TaxID=1964365 RepID=UPI00356730D0
MGDIVWLASYPKSGNTWARTFLHNLFVNRDQPADLAELKKFPLGDGSKIWFERASGKKIAELSEADITALIPKVHRLYTRTRPDTVFVKTHSAVRLIDGVPLITPNVTAGALYFIRNPLDISLSFADHFGLSIDETIERMNDPDTATAESEDKVREYIGSWSNHAKSWLSDSNKSRVHVMRYEDMLYKPEKTFGAMAKYLGVRPTRERLKKAIRFSSFKVSRKLEEEKGFSEKSGDSQRFFRVGKAGQWKTQLSPAQVERIIEANYDMMKQFKYLPPKR